MSAHFPQTRLRRLRQHPKVRALVREQQLAVDDFIYPLFVKQGLSQKKAIKSMPGQFQLSLQDLTAEITEIVQLKIPAVLVFGIPEHKDAEGSDAYAANGITQQAIKIIKQTAPELLVITDLCCCEYTDHGHCGIIDDHTGCLDVNNDKTLAVLQKQALAHVQAGADMVAPSGMIDGMVHAIRSILDQHHFEHIPILSYTAKYASCLYGPFRDAAEGTPQFGDRRSHQMDPANGNEALREAKLDIAEGADILMVKPASLYADVIYRIKEQHPTLPLCAYHVSGEYTMIKTAAQQGWLDEQKLVLETMLSLKRAGADMIITYFAKDLARWLQ